VDTEKGFYNFLKSARSVTRLANLSEYHGLGGFGNDVILADNILFLGRWNDGVVVDL
jgi:hypothetical protein